jgi:hypothetical protein
LNWGAAGIGFVISFCDSNECGLSFKLRKSYKAKVFLADPVAYINSEEDNTRKKMSFTDSSDSDLEFIDTLRTTKKRKIQDRKRFIETLDDNEFKRRFRMNKTTFILLLKLVEKEIATKTNRHVHCLVEL